MSFHPYLFFGGNCREAFTRYEEIFGGELTVMTMKDVPGEEPPPAGDPDLVLHAALTFQGHLLMGSDDPMDGSFGPVHGMMVCYSTSDLTEGKRVFAALADGGQTTQAMIETFFSPGFGMCTDRFGTPWMVTVDGATSGGS